MCWLVEDITAAYRRRDRARRKEIAEESQNENKRQTRKPRVYSPERDSRSKRRKTSDSQSLQPVPKPTVVPRNLLQEKSILPRGTGKDFQQQRTESAIPVSKQPNYVQKNGAPSAFKPPSVTSTKRNCDQALVKPSHALPSANDKSSKHNPAPAISNQHKEVL